MGDNDEIMLIDLLFNNYLHKLYLDEKVNLTLDDDKFITEFNGLVEKYFSNLEIDEEDAIDRHFVETLEYTVYKGVLDFKVNQNMFFSHLESRYAKAFSSSDALYILSMEVGKTTFKNQNISENLFNEALKLLHMKACQIYAEISTLIKNGFGTGAMARYRSIYETSIVFEYILQKGEKAAQAYLDYLIVADMKEQKLLEELYNEDYIKNEKLTLKFNKEKDNLAEKYDQQFVNLDNNDYVWAYYTMENPSGHNFGIKQLREEINRNDGAEHYKLASNIIHSSTSSVFSDLGNPYRSTLSGGSNIGLSKPITLASFEMMNINNALINRFLTKDNIPKNLKELFTMKTNYMLYKEIEESYTAIENEILNDFCETDNHRIY